MATINRTCNKNIRYSKKFPVEELHGLQSQMRRCAVSIPSNVAEGFARKSSKDNARFVVIAYGSVAELETQLIISKNLGYISDDMYTSIEMQPDSLKAMIYKYRSYLTSQPTDVS